ncbi:hypothetical protein ACFFNY_22090 [Paenibacillus hodogayensis]|uniref:Uncharacterized protein n=1 Tax=Paenibacillus hodogayensis TaxID=279208 RepID=A0ABV5W164_9BACL
MCRRFGRCLVDQADDRCWTEVWAITERDPPPGGYERLLACEVGLEQEAGPLEAIVRGQL